MENIKKELSYNERTKELTAVIRKQDSDVKSEYKDILNEKGIKRLFNSLKQEKNEFKEGIETLNKSIDDLKIKINAQKKIEKDLTPEQKQLIIDLKAIKKTEDLENNRTKLENFEKRLKDVKNRLKEIKKDMEDIKHKVKFKLE